MLLKRNYAVEIIDEKSIDDFKKNHFALLRFRTDKIQQETEIGLEQVKTAKAIYHDGNLFNETNIFFNNQYSYKVCRKYQQRSIENLADGIRYQPPEDFSEQLKKRCIETGVVFTKIENTKNFLKAIKFQEINALPIISTIPMPTINEIFFNFEINFLFDEIQIVEFNISNCDVNQTIYFPDFEKNTPYRISITNNVIKCEFSLNSCIKSLYIRDLIQLISNSFGLNFADLLEKIKLDLNESCSSIAKKQKFGKILPIAEPLRQSIIYNLTKEHNIYSLGRFSCWRNILLDDVVDDVKIIDKLIKNSSIYYSNFKNNIKDYTGVKKVLENENFKQ